jgi:hypothetical protein
MIISNATIWSITLVINYAQRGIIYAPRGPIYDIYSTGHCSYHRKLQSQHIYLNYKHITIVNDDCK